MKSTKNLCRLLSLMLSVLLLFACMPLSAVAADAEFVSENVLRTKLESSKGIIMYAETGTVVDGDRFNAWASQQDPVQDAYANVTDGNTTQTSDVYGALDWDPVRYVGVQFTLTESTYVGDAVIYSGFTTAYDTFSVYASNNLEDLYTEARRVGSDIVCTGAAQTVAINASVKYIAFVCTDYELYNARVAELEVWSAEETTPDEPDEGGFVSENALRTKVESSKGILMFQSNGYVEDGDRFNAWASQQDPVQNAYANVTDGDKATVTDVYGALDWDPVRYVGVLFTLTENTYIGNAVIYSGFATAYDTFAVYASNSLSDLYTEAKCVGSDIVCTGTAQTVAINASVKYIAFVCTDYQLYNARVAELEAWTAEDPNPSVPEEPGDDYVSENLLQDESVTSTLTGKYVSGDILDTNKFDVRGALAGATDDELTTQYAVNGCLDYEHPFYAGVMYTLAENEFVDNLKLYASGTFLVYAGDALDTLYSTANCVADMVTVSTTGTEIEINKYVKYLSIFCVGYADVVEFQLWSGEPAGAVVPDNTTLRVLTLGNSFSENTSRYASEIADNLGLELTFGYLKFPSCSIGQYLEAAQNDWSLFKFEYTGPNGTRTTVKTEAGAFDAASSNSATHASIAEALNFTDWDVVVFQMDSYNSLAASSFDALPALIEYVKGIESNAKLMLHEVWAWGVWDGSDAYKNFANIKANNEAAAIASDISIIPSGLSFENARDALDSYTILNENDGYYQHANDYGCYVAGATYVATLFGVEIPANTFDGHAYVDNNGYVQTLNAAVNAAVKYYNSYGDANNNGEVENTDVVSLRKYLLGADTVETTLADANYNGEIDITDLIRVKKFLAGVEVVLGPSK